MALITDNKLFFISLSLSRLCFCMNASEIQSVQVPPHAHCSHCSLIARTVRTHTTDKQTCPPPYHDHNIKQFFIFSPKGHMVPLHRCHQKEITPDRLKHPSRLMRTIFFIFFCIFFLISLPSFFSPFLLPFLSLIITHRHRHHHRHHHP